MAAALLLGAVLACSGGDDAPADAGLEPDAGALDPRVVVGTGQDTFVPLADGDEVELIVGPQGGGREGGLHIWMAVQAYDIPLAEMALLSFVVTSTGSEDVEGSVTRDPQNSPVQSDPSRRLHQLIGVNPPIMDCCRIANGEAWLSVSLTTTGGDEYEDRRRVRVSSCPGPGQPGPDLCP